MPRGFSLVETIFAIALLTGALVTLAQLVAAGVQTTSAAQYRTIATIAAQQKLEELRGESTLNDVSNAVEHRDADGVRVCTGATPCAAAVFTVRWSVTPSASTPGAVLIQVSAAHAHRSDGQVRSFGIRPRSIR